MRNKRVIYKHVRNKFCPREILRLVILSTTEYCCQLKVSADRGTHRTGFQFDAPRLIQEGCVMYQGDDEENISLVQNGAGPRDPGYLVLFCLRCFKVLGGLLRVVRYLRNTTNIGLISWFRSPCAKWK